MDLEWCKALAAQFVHRTAVLAARLELALVPAPLLPTTDQVLLLPYKGQTFVFPPCPQPQ